MSRKDADADLPIDIHYDKLLEWLISRKKVPAKWQDAIRVVREKIDAALVQLPLVPEISQICSNTYINYYHCEQIFSLLQQAEGDQSKSIFGRYNSALMHQWDEILKLYRKDCIFLAEAARSMVQNVQYELPTMKKSIQESERLVTELNRKRVYYDRSSQAYEEKFASSCQKLEISGDDIRAAVVASGKRLDGLIDALQTAASEERVGECIDFYTAFTHFHLKVSMGDKFDESKLPALVQSLRKARNFKHDDESFVPLDAADYQIESASEAPAIQLDLDEEVVAPVDIDFDTDAVEIDGSWAITTDGGADDATAPQEISWEIDCAPEEGAAAPPSINFDLDLDDTGAAESDAIVVEKPSVAVSGSLHEAASRHAFVSDLMELEAFFLTRLTELTDSAFQNLPPLPGAPAAVACESVDSCRARLACVQELLTAVRDPRLVQLLMIRTSTKFVDRLVNSLEQQRATVTKMAGMSTGLESRIEENMANIRTTHPLLQRMIAQTKELQRNVEKSIGAQYEGRKVNIIGEINTI